MFAKACERVYKFTRPLIISTRTVDGTVSSSCGTFIIINPEGWILTAGHLFDSFVKYQQDMKKIKEVEEINARKASMAVPGAMTLPDTIQPDPKWITNHSFWWGGDGLRITSVYVNREIDIALAKLDGFRPDMVQEYPIFRDPDTMRPGTSICRTGFPFANIATDFDEGSKSFRIRNGVLPLPFFPNDGIHTRNVLKQNKSKEGNYDMLYVETSTPGLKGQSGGPIFDTNGHIYAMQVQTNHIPLGFHPISEYDGKSIVENQFLNVGIGVHGKLLQQIMRDHHISFKVEGDSSEEEQYIINE
ncbi:serine protease [Methanomethylophilus alvi]|uniref:serine protease n=1 Tax=Methanomethylophilus alvi TaxID=1291540 RepID=UPI002AA1B396|nr:serine protease [Methanomethylophilus alvi]MDY7061017.1 serine protease [Methanomethylophilus alvi]